MVVRNAVDSKRSAARRRRSLASIAGLTALALAGSAVAPAKPVVADVHGLGRAVEANVGVQAPGRGRDSQQGQPAGRGGLETSGVPGQSEAPTPSQEPESSQVGASSDNRRGARGQGHEQGQGVVHGHGRGEGRGQSGNSTAGGSGQLEEGAQEQRGGAVGGVGSRVSSIGGTGARAMHARGGLGSTAPTDALSAAVGKTPRVAPAAVVPNTVASTTTVPAPPPSTAGVTPTNGSTQAPPVGVPAPLTASVQRPSKVPRDARHKSRAPGSATRRDARVAASGATPSTETGRAGASAERARGTERGSASRHGGTAPGGNQLLARTITRIVAVIPLPFWIAIGVLAAVGLAMAARSRMTVVRARGLERQRAELLADVGLLQGALLPTVPARLGPVTTSVAYRPAEGPGAGGDFYDVFALEDGTLGVILGDVSGHGRQALPYTALVRFTLRAYLEAGLEPRETLRTAELTLEHQLGESFVTAAVATYDPRERVLTYSCAGHPPPIVLGRRPLHAITSCAAPLIGAGLRTGTRQTRVWLPGGAEVCFYTDGLTEARVGGELFGSERVERTLAELGPKATAAELIDRVAERTSARPDDMAACLLSVDGDPENPRVLVEELELNSEEVADERVERFLRVCGVDSGEIPVLVDAVRAEILRAGTVRLELHLVDERLEVVFRSENVKPLRNAGSRLAGTAGR